MVNIVIINKGGNCKTLNVKNFVKDDLYKKCGFKSSNNFDHRHTWNIKLKGNNLNIEVHAKNNSKANTENKFDLPPPIDSELYFGNIALIAYHNKKIVDINVDDWCKIYEKLMGGFENLGDQDTSEDEDEEDDISPEQLTKEGYMKDDFIVDSDDDVETDTEADKPIKNNKKQQNDEDDEDDEDTMTEEETSEDESFEISNGDDDEDDEEDDDDDEDEDDSDVISELSEEEYINE
uniref:Uncharacterized protein n=1 Tax=viral metagenome TaxID=1070528 RepID=A0A6C0KET1_9ZZZZ